jgi:hypothetical protein
VGRLLLLCLLVGCGRVGFEDTTTAADGTPAPDGGSNDAAPTTGIAFVSSPIQHTGPKATSDSVALQATNANDALAILVACAGSQIPSTVTVSAPGWTFTQLAPLTKNTVGQVYAAAFGAIVPDTTATTLTIDWGGTNCNRGQSSLADEFTRTDPTGGTTTFDSTNAASGAGDCTTSVTTANANDAVWAACYAATALTGVGPGYTKSAADAVGDFAEYKLTTDAASTTEQVTFTNPNGYVVVAASIKPLP